MVSRNLHLDSHRHGQLIKGDGQPPVHWLLSGQLIVSPTNVLDEGMATTTTWRSGPA
jgi:hypothetical protein